MGGYKLVYPKDTFKITILSEKPVPGNAMNTEQSDDTGFPADSPVPTYMKEGIAWGFINPEMVMEKATDSAKEFILAGVRPLTLLLTDAGWLHGVYDMTPPFTYPHKNRWTDRTELQFLNNSLFFCCHRVRQLRAFLPVNVVKKVMMKGD